MSEESPKDAKVNRDEISGLRENRLHRLLIQVLLMVMAAEWLYLLFHARWLSLFLVTLIVATLFGPVIFRQKLDIEVPAEFHLMAVIFIFASLYLGEVKSFYHRLWWWDIALHASAGVLMGILGFLLVYVLNESKRVELHMTPGFMAFFAFIFAVAIGALWEIFEFTMDRAFGTNMQKPMFNDLSGLTDTMWDMIVNTLGAFVICFAGWRYMRQGRTFFVKRWIRKFIRQNPLMFKK